MQFSQDQFILTVTSIALSLGTLAAFFVALLVRHYRAGARQQRALLHAMADTEESERRRIAEDLHDGLGQLLAAVKLQADALRHASAQAQRELDIATVKRTVDLATSEVRNVVRNLVPRNLENGGLVAALEELVAALNKSHALHVSFVREGNYCRFEPRVELTLYRVYQELVANAVKHASATRVDIVLAQTDDWLDVEVADDGVGFDFARAHSGHGMRNVANRAKVYKGSVRYERNGPSGVRVRIRFETKHLRS